MVFLSTTSFDLKPNESKTFNITNIFNFDLVSGEYKIKAHLIDY